MSKERRLLAVWLILIFLDTIFLTSNVAALTAGVKSGDWIEYQVAITGNIPPEHNSTWAKIEVTQVQGAVINLKVTTTFENSPPLVETVVLNLDAGILGDCFIIPANLNVGDSFFDSQQGSLTITSATQKTIAGAARTLISAATTETIYFWDQNTGILIEAHTTTPDFSMTTKAIKTNMWQEQTSPVVLYIIAFVAATLLAATALFISRKKKLASP